MAQANTPLWPTGTELSALPQTGSILREYWTNLPGSAVNDLLDHPDYPDRPNGRDYVDLLEVPAVGATNYGCRLVGYLHPPVTGQYIFWIAASPAAAVNLSPDENPANAVRIFGDNFDFGRGRESKPREWERKASDIADAIATHHARGGTALLHRSGAQS